MTQETAASQEQVRRWDEAEYAALRKRGTASMLRLITTLRSGSHADVAADADEVARDVRQLASVARWMADGTTP